MSYTIRHSTTDDIDTLLDLAEVGRRRMRQNGNMEQWTNGYPSVADFMNDMENNISYIVEDKGKTIATFAFMHSPEPTYLKIYDGSWLNNEPYYVIHRLAALPQHKGIFDNVLTYCMTKADNIRIDTHRDNAIMRHLMEKHGFVYCGIVYMMNGDERVAYQKVI